MSTSAKKSTKKAAKKATKKAAKRGYVVQNRRIPPAQPGDWLDADFVEERDPDGQLVAAGVLKHEEREG